MSQSLSEPSSNSETSSSAENAPFLTPVEKSLVVIFDWDNTLFATDYLKAQNLDFSAIFDSTTTLEQQAFYLKSQIEELEKVSCLIFYLILFN